MKIRYALPCAGLFALAGAHCASTSQQASESPNPTTRAVASSQQASEEALKRAAEAQKQASDQGKKVAEAQGRVRKDQEQLRQDQETLRQEQAKAQQLQSEANQETQQASQQAQQQQQRASTALSQQTHDIARGQQIAAGVVTQVRPDEVVVQPASGQAMHFRVNDSTQVQIQGRMSSADQIREGQQARVAYETGTEGPTAVRINVSNLGTSTGEQGMGSGSSSSGTGSSSPQATPPSQSQSPDTTQQPPPPPSSDTSGSHGY